jgi:ribosomal protein L7Ae-like RNA K-turn-binding protein
MSELGHWVGADADRAVVSVNDNNFAKAISDIYNILIQTEKG